MKAIPLVVVLAAATPSAAQRAWLDWLPARAEVAQFHAVDLSPIVASVPLPGSGPIRGMAHGAGRVWLARGDALFAIDPAQGTTHERTLPAGLLGLAADQGVLYVLTANAVQVFDASTVARVREMPLPPHDGGEQPGAIGCHAGAVHVALGRRLIALDPGTGAVRELLRTPSPLHWLCSDGNVLWGGDSGRIRPVVGGESAKATGLVLPLPVTRSAGTLVGTKWLCAFDWTSDRGAPLHTAGYLRLDGEPVWGERLEIRIFKAKEGLRYEVGPKPVSTLALVTRELARIAKDPSARVKHPDGRSVIVPVALRASPGVLVEDLGVVWDAATECGFAEVFCARADEKLRVVEPPPPPPPPERKDGR